MGTKLLYTLTVAILFLMPTVNFGQAPNLGTTSGFALFTASGAFGNSGASSITGNIGSNSESVTGFPPGTIIGTIYNPPDATLAQAAIDVGIAYGNFSTGGTVLGTPLETPGVLFPGVYSTGGAATLNGDLTLNGGGDPDALFIININGVLTIGASSHIILTNSASLCNVYWQINGEFTLGNGSVFKGTIVSGGAIHLLEGSSLEGRGLTTAGAIDLQNNIVTNPLVVAAGTITGTAIVCQGQAGVVYSVPMITNATGYNWTLPAGATISAGLNTNSITVNFSSIASSGNITVYGSNSCGNGIVSPNYAVTVNPLPTTSLVYHF